MYKVMLVDDEIYMLNGLKSITGWEEHGLEIAATASNGAHALQIAEHQKIDILLTDIKMPKMDGLELIQNLKQRNMAVKSIILSGYDDFEYVKKALKLGIENYLLKPVNEEELSQTLLNTVEKIESELKANIRLKEDSIVLKNNILNRWMTNSIEPSELAERAQMLGLQLKCQCYLICILKLVDDGNPRQFTDKNHARNSIMDICIKTIDSSFKAEVFSDLTGNILLLFSGNSSDINSVNIKKIMQNCIDTIRREFSLNTFISIGSIENDFHYVGKSYENAKGLLEYGLILEPNRIIDFEEKYHSHINITMSFHIDTEHLENLILAGKSEEVSSYIDIIYKKAFSTPDISPKTIKSISMELLYTIIRLAKEKKIRCQHLPDLLIDHYSVIYRMDNKTQLIGIIKETALNVIRGLNEKNENICPLVRRTIEYISSNISTDISLKQLASAYNVNASYLGQLFKNETGEMFTNYVNKMRMEKAKQILAASDLNANEIALQVGYSNPNYFYNCFKKLTGKFPTEYRRDIRRIQL